MSPVDPTSLARSVLHEALAAGATGLYREEAAVGLLIAHGVWLHRADFLRSCASVEDDAALRDGTATVAALDWEAVHAFTAGSLPASSSEIGVLQVAAMLAIGELGHYLVGLDATNLSLVLDAIAHCAGWHERSLAHLVSGAIGARASATSRASSNRPRPADPGGGW